MFQVKVMSVKEYSFAVDLANTVGWGMEEADFRFNQFLEPEGCLVLFEGLVPVGLATCVSFEKLGWFGNFVVRSNYRGHGGGRLLLEHAISYLRSRGVESIGLYAYPWLVEFYGKFGFKKDIELKVMHNVCLQMGNNYNYKEEGVVSKVGVCGDFSGLSSFDVRFFGVDRSRVLKGIMEGKDNYCYVLRDGGKVVGYVLAKDYGHVVEVGPLVCCPDRSEGVFELLQTMLCGLGGREVWLYLPQEQKGVEEFLFGVGFRKKFSLSRMFLGEPKIQRGIYLGESLERG